ncbi:MAG: carboxypeptidase regulatory-like domain-containing protein [Candidatus Acidiferrales bacterium]
MRKRMFFLVTLCAAALCVSPRVFGQANASFSGTVVDKSGAAISGASVKAISQDTGAIREAKSDDGGRYLIPVLPRGNFTIRVEFQGFQPAESKDIVLQVDEHRELNFTLAPASVSSQVEVVGTAVAVETANASLGQVVTATEVANLPLNGRDFVQLATLTPGTVTETSTASFFSTGPSSEVATRGSFSLSVGGSRVNSTDWLLDGNDNNELTAGGVAIFPSIDAIQEFKVLAYTYSAEWGTRAGPTVLVTTKSGSNAFHGSLFEFFRNTALDARSFFTTSTGKFNLNQFGGSLGGPIKKGKTFFFIDLEQKDLRQGLPYIGLVPTPAMLNGDFSHDVFGNALPPGSIFNPYVTGAANTDFQCDSSGNPIPALGDGSQPAGTNCNKIPSNLFNPLAQTLVGFYPQPNASNQALDYNYVSDPVRDLNEKKFDVKLDHNFSPADTIMARFSYDQANSYVPGGASGFAEQNAFASNQFFVNHGRNAVISETHVFSPNTVNQITGGYNRIFDYISSQGTGSCESAKLGIIGANLTCSSNDTCVPGGVSCGLTSAQVSAGYFAIGDRGFTPDQGGTNIFSISDALDLIRGKHDIKVGLGIRANEMNVRTEGFQDGYWIFTGVWSGQPEADFLLGLTSLAIHDQAFNGPTTGRRWKMFRPYVQDDWRVSKNLTVNLGLAWALTTPEKEAHNRQANFNPANGQFLIAGQNAGPDVGIIMDKTALEPRIGVAWKPFSSDKTVVRGGYSIYHDSSWNQGDQGLWQNPPYYAESDFFGFGGGCPFATSACATTYGMTPGGLSISSGFPIFTQPPVPADFSGTILAQNLNFKLGMIQQFNVDVEHQLPGQIVLTVGYVGSRSSHILTDGNNLNVGSPSACGGAVPGYTTGCGPNGASFGVPYSAFPYSDISDVEDVGAAHYNSLQVKAETKSSKYGIYALIGYTYARDYDNSFSDDLGTPLGATYFPLPGWQKLDWARSQTNLDNDFTASVVYTLPFGRGKHFGHDWSGPLNVIAGGWEVTGIEKITSGFPVFIIDSNNVSGVGFDNGGNDFSRPNQTCNPRLSHPTLNEWFNTSCFSTPVAGELGNAGRAPATGPDFVNTDFSLIKQFPLPREGMRLEFRSEFFNIWNHPQFALPGEPGTPDDFNAPSLFGVVDSTVNNPRLIQFALKLQF